MKILLTGGGSGGHITPLLAVAHELKRKSPESTLSYIGEFGSRFGHIMDRDSALFTHKHRIFAGKFRRYHGESWLKKLFDVQTNFLNIRDGLLLIIGFIQSLILLGFSRPDIIFIKGGYVGLPVGLAATLLRIPYITHDSDAIAGLTNKVIGRKALVNAVGFREGFYRYDKTKVIATGIPIREDFKNIKLAEVNRLKSSLGIKPGSRVVLITGGSNGARRLNEGLIKIIPKMLAADKNLYIIHQLGASNLPQYDGYDSDRLLKKEYISELALYSKLADLVITRAGASALAEYSAQNKTCIVVPNPYLAGGHQLKNAEALKNADAAVIIEEKILAKDSERVQKTIQDLAYDDEQRNKYGSNLGKLFQQDAATELASIILKSK